MHLWTEKNIHLYHMSCDSLINNSCFSYTKAATNTYFWNICSEGGNLPGNSLSVRWYSNIVICSVDIEVLLENRYLFSIQKSVSGKLASLFSSYKDARRKLVSVREPKKSSPGKSVSVRWTHKQSSWKIGICSVNTVNLLEKSWKKVLLEEKNRYFRK